MFRLRTGSRFFWSGSGSGSNRPKTCGSGSSALTCMLFFYLGTCMLVFCHILDTCMYVVFMSYTLYKTLLSFCYLVPVGERVYVGPAVELRLQALHLVLQLIATVPQGPNLPLQHVCAVQRFPAVFSNSFLFVILNK